MIVVLIIGVLAALATASFVAVRGHTAETLMRNDARQISSAANQYFIKHGRATVSASELIGDTDNYLIRLSTGVRFVSPDPMEVNGIFILTHDWVGDRQYHVNTGDPATP